MHHSLTVRSKLIIMLSVMASLFLVALDQTIISAALGTIVEEFDAYSALSWIVTAYLITTTVTTPIAGKLSDLFGRRIMLLIGVSIFGGASLFAGLSDSIGQLILWRAVQGIGGGIITANAFTIVGDLFNARERGKWQGIIGATFGVSSVVGPLLGGFLTESHNLLGMTTDWRWTFFINVPIAIAAFVVIAIFCPQLRHAGKFKIDYIGVVLLSAALTLLVLSLENTAEIFEGFLASSGWSLAGLRVVLLSVVALLIAALVFVERRHEQPILTLSFFTNKNFLLIMGIAMTVGAAMLGSILYLTQFNQQVFGASPTESGLMLLPMIGGLMVTSIITGQLVAKTGHYKRFMIIGFLTAAIAIGALTTLTPESSYLHEAIIMVFVGVGIGAAMPLLNIAVQNEFSPKLLGAATSSSQLFRGLGSTIGVAVFGGLLTSGIVSSLGNIQDDAYIQTLRASPAAERLTDLKDTNTLLNLNTVETKAAVRAQADTSLQNLPPQARDRQARKLEQQQAEYSDKITHAFSDSLRVIFLATSGLMGLAFLMSLAITERKLRDTSTHEAMA